MAKWFGNIGFEIKDVEQAPGIWGNEIKEIPYYGELINDRWNRQNSTSINSEIELANMISIIADPFLETHCSSIAYVIIMNDKWKVSNIDASQRPRLILTIGGLYNG